MWTPKCRKYDLAVCTRFSSWEIAPAAPHLRLTTLTAYLVFLRGSGTLVPLPDFCCVGLCKLWTSYPNKQAFVRDLNIFLGHCKIYWQDRMNLTEEENEAAQWSTDAIWQRAENPEVHPTFFLVSGIWLTFNFFIGVGCNGSVLYAYLKHSGVFLKICYFISTLAIFAARRPFPKKVFRKGLFEL